MSRAALLVVVASLLSACAPDSHGDLRDAVRLHPAAPHGRLTFSGIGVGSALGEARAAFGGELAFPWDGTHLAHERVADFGTKLDVWYGLTRDGADAISGLTLEYRGNPVAVSRLAGRWREVFSAIPGACAESGCQWNDEEGRMIALLTTTTRWSGPSSLTVTIER